VCRHTFASRYLVTDEARYVLLRSSAFLSMFSDYTLYGNFGDGMFVCFLPGTVVANFRHSSNFKDGLNDAHGLHVA
jgi:hypothetical protein